MKELVNIVWLASRAVRVCFKENHGNKWLAKTTIIGIGSLMMGVLGFISLIFSAFFLLVGMYFTPAAATLMIGCFFFILAAIGVWACRYFVYKKHEHSRFQCFESVARAFMDGYNASKTGK